MKRRFLSLLMALIMALSLLPTTALAAKNNTSGSHTAKVRVIPVYEDDSKYLGYDPDYTSNVYLDLTCLSQNCGSGNINHTVKISDFHPDKLGWTIRSGYEWKGWIKYTQNLKLNNVKNPPLKTYYSWSKETTNLIVGQTNEIYMVYGKKDVPVPTLPSVNDDVVKNAFFTITCTNSSAAHNIKTHQFKLEDLSGGYSIDSNGVQKDSEGYYFDVKVETEKYVDRFDLIYADEIEHTLVYEADANLTIRFRWNESSKTWKQDNFPVVRVSCTTPQPTEPDLSITKTTKAKDVKVGELFEYTITVSNAAGAGKASNVVVKDTLPVGLEYVSYYLNPNGYELDWTFEPNGQELTWTFTEIPAGASATITLTVKAVNATPEGDAGYTNAAYIEGKENSPGTAPSVPVGNALTLTKTPDVQTVNVGEIFSYTMKVKNVSEADATNVEVEDVLPDSLEFYAESVSGNSGIYRFEQNAQALKWTFGTIPAGEEVTITLRVKAISAGAVKNSASIVGVTKVTSEDVSIVTPGKGTLTVVKKVSSKLDEDADFTFTLKRYTTTENGRVLDEKFTHEPIVVRVAKGSDTGSATVDLPEIPVSTVYTVEEENPIRELKMAGTTGVFSKAEYVGEMKFPNGSGGSVSTGEMQSNTFTALWPGQEITSVTITCTNTYELLQPGTYTVTYYGNGNTSGTAPTDSKLYAAGEQATILGRNTLVKSGYTFRGWSQNSSAASASYTAGDKLTITGNVALYAVWSKDSTPEEPTRSDGTLIINKTDANDGSKLSGAYFTVYRQNGSKWVEECTIRTTNGYASTGLDNGKYYVVETMAPAGYTIDETEHRFTISNNTVTLDLTNDKTATPAALNDSDHFAYVIGYEDGTVQPNGNITRAEVATIFFRLLTDEVREENMSTSNPFSDVKSTAWYNRAVSTLYQLDILKGSNDGKFHPNDTITRAEFAAIAARFSDKKVSGSTPFTDLAGHWAKDEVTAAASLGWVNGYTDGTFKPNQPITRAEAMTLVNRVLNRSPKSVDDLLDNMVKWPDNADTSKWYYLAVQEATNSHDYKASGSSESWTKLTKAPDWAALEH